MLGPKQLSNKCSLRCDDNDLPAVNKTPKRSPVFSVANFNHEIPRWSFRHFPLHLYSRQGECDSLGIACTHCSESALLPCMPLLSAAAPSGSACLFFFFFSCCLHQGRHLYTHSAIARAFARPSLSSSVVSLPLPSLSSVGLPPSCLYCFGQNRKSNEAWPSQSKMSDLGSTAFPTCPLSSEVFALRGMHGRVEASDVTIFLKILDDGLLRLHHWCWGQWEWREGVSTPGNLEQLLCKLPFNYRVCGLKKTSTVWKLRVMFYVVRNFYNLISELGRSPREGKGYPLQYSGLENSVDCIVHGITKSWNDWVTFTSLFDFRPRRQHLK